MRQFETEKGITTLIQAIETCQSLLSWAKDNKPRLEEYPTISPLFALQTILDNIYERQYFFYRSKSEKIWNWIEENNPALTRRDPERIIADFDTGHKNSELIYSKDKQAFISFEKYQDSIRESRWRIWKSPREATTDVLSSAIQIYTAKFSPNGSVIAIIGRRLGNQHHITTQFYDLDGKLLGEFNSNSGFYIRQIEFNFDASKAIIIECLDGGEGTQRLHFLEKLMNTTIFRRPSNQFTYVYIGEVSHHRYYGSARFAADGYSLVTGERNAIDYPIRVWNLKPHYNLQASDSDNFHEAESEIFLNVDWANDLANCIEQDTVIASLKGAEDFFVRVFLSPQKQYIAFFTLVRRSSSSE